jgi:phosphate transport system substrate-binding protein
MRDPILHCIGSPGRGALLAAALVCALVAVRAQAEEIRIGGTGAAMGTMQVLADAYAKRDPAAKITLLPSVGSGGGIKAVLAGVIQIAVSARPVNEAEAKAGAVDVEYGRTPFVFATSPGTRATGLTTENLIDIYAGALDQWPDGTKIRLVMRPAGDSDSEMIRGMSPAMREAVTKAEQRKGVVFSVTDHEAADSLELIPGALGPSTLALMRSEKRRLKALALNGVTPDVKTIADGSYPLQKQLRIVTSPKTSAEAHAFVAFVRSSTGQEILRQCGYWVMN